MSPFCYRINSASDALLRAHGGANSAKQRHQPRAAVCETVVERTEAPAEGGSAPGGSRDSGRGKKREAGHFVQPLEERRLPTLPLGVAVPSALAGLTSLFGMGRGGSPLLKPPQYMS